VAAGESSPAGGIYLRNCLTPLEQFLARPEVTDVYVNHPGEAWVETVGGELERHEILSLDEATLMRLARQIAALSHQGISREHPLLSAVLPDGSRVQVVAPPATRRSIAFAIRKHVAPELRLDDYVASGAFTATATVQFGRQPEAAARVARLVNEGQIASALREAVRGRQNILISGGTSTGKTTFLNALIREVPLDERLVLIEDAPELHVHHRNHVGLIAVRGVLGEAQVSANELVSASLRMRPDRIILGELRGVEALAFLRAVNSGHPGSMTTIHADSPEAAVEQLVLLALESGTELTRDDVRHYVSRTIDVFVQLGRTRGRRAVQQLVLRPMH
jgi:type IV secretion system protein VirB11